jgi:NAD(P)-binding Rossmann-like domain
MKILETDYLIVGSGAVGMAFADVLLKETSASIIIVDKHHGPGGHWNDAYSFVRLHQPSAYYGVSSKPLGANAKDTNGLNAGMYERASAAELVSYYEQVMRDFQATGRVQYFALSEYLGDFQFKGLLSGESYRVKVNKKLVDTTYLNTAVPATHPPKYAIAAGVQCVPLNALPTLKKSYPGYVVVGAGKTGIDAALWLLEMGVNPDLIHWIMPRDSWFQNRANVQPGREFFSASYGALAQQVEDIVAADSLPDAFKRLNASGQLLRIHETVEPTMYHGAIISYSEIEALKRIKHVVRLGRIQSIEKTQIVLDQGTIPAAPDYLYIDCSANAAQRRPSIPVFDGNTITPQFVRVVQPTFSAALIAHVEATMDNEVEKNKLCTVVPLPDEPVHYLSMMAAGMANQYRWSKNEDLRQWIGATRLDGFTALARNVKKTDVAEQALLQRYGKAIGPAAEKLKQWLTPQK